MLRAVWVRALLRASSGDCQRLPFLGLLGLIRVAELSPFCPVLVPRNPIRRYYNRVSTWLFLSTIFSGTNQNCIQQPSGPTCHSGATAAGCSHNRRQERWFPKLSQETARRHYSFNVDNNNSNIWAPLRKANKMKAIPHEASCRQSPAQEQGDPESYWIREQPCGHCKAERTQQWLFQHFFKPVSPPPEKDTSLEEDVYNFNKEYI
uniref:Uncharacterized protein n=1 Tax=Aquila chrysaetos chrysaetos TaxID=223781 RepID=A0A663DVT2_AQUCH